MTRRLQSVANSLKLDSMQYAALTGDSGLTGVLTSDQTTLQSNDETLKTDWAALSTQLIGAPTVPPAELPAIQALLAGNFQTRVASAGEIVSALESLSEPLSAEQTANLPKLVEMLVGGAGATRPRRARRVSERSLLAAGLNPLSRSATHFRGSRSDSPKETSIGM